MLIRNKSEEQMIILNSYPECQGILKVKWVFLLGTKKDGLLIESALSFTRSKSRELVQATSPRRKLT